MHCICICMHSYAYACRSMIFIEFVAFRGSVNKKPQTIFHSLWWILTLFVSYVSTTAARLDPAKCKIYGPGIENSDFHVPVRYFFVRLVQSDGRNVNTSAGEAFLVVDNLDQPACSIWWKTIDRHDGSYIIRYKLFKKCSRLKLGITTPEGVHLANSPYTLNGPLYPDFCKCPRSLSKWTESMDCTNDYQQLEEDLVSWPKRSINFSWVLEDAGRRWAAHPGAYSYCHYVIVDNQITRKCYGEHVGFKMFSDAILLSLTRKVSLPNVQFLMNLGDWPLENGESGPFVPMFSWCGSKTTKDIVLPTYELTESTLEMMGRQSLDIFSAQDLGRRVHWTQKIEKGFWRGRDSREERLQLVALSRKHPDLLDAGITRFFFFRDQMDAYGPEVPSVGFEEFFKFKYQVSVDGTVAAYRLPYLLAGNSLVLKQDSDYYEHFYRQLKPWKHYVPVKGDLTDLLDKIQWARQHDDEAESITQRATRFVHEHLNPKEIFCYYVQGLLEFADRLSEPPNILPNGDGFERVQQPGAASDCQCENEDDHAADVVLKENLKEGYVKSSIEIHTAKDEL